MSGCGANARDIVHSRRRLGRVGRPLNLDVRSRWVNATRDNEFGAVRSEVPWIRAASLRSLRKADAHRPKAQLGAFDGAIFPAARIGLGVDVIRAARVSVVWVVAIGAGELCVFGGFAELGMHSRSALAASVGRVLTLVGADREM